MRCRHALRQIVEECGKLGLYVCGGIGRTHSFDILGAALLHDFELSPQRRRQLCNGTGHELAEGMCTLASSEDQQPDRAARLRYIIC